MPMDNALHGRQADADAGEFLFAVQALESAKQLVGLFHIKTSPIIPHKISRAPIRLWRRAEFNLGAGAPGSEFPGIAQQVLQHDPQ